MKSLGIILVMLTSLWAKDLNYLKHGALVGTKGKVFLVEDTITVRIKFPQLLEVPRRLKQITGKLTDTVHDLHTRKHTQTNMFEEQSDDLNTLIMNKIIIFNDTLNNALENFHLTQNKTESASMRRKRGLFDGLGYIARSLFGTAMDSDVRDIKKNYGKVLSWIMKTNKVIDIHNKDLIKLNGNLNKLRNYTNLLSNSINNLMDNVDEVNTVTKVSLILSTVEQYLMEILDQNKNFLQNIIDAAHGYVNSNLFTVQDLRYTINLAKEKYSLTSIFSLEDMIQYYPLLSSFLTMDSIVINIPFRSSHNYQLFEIEPFPMLVNNSMYMLDSPKTLVITDNEHSSYAKISHDDLITKCHASSIGKYFCPASIFSLIPTRQHGVCELQLLMINSSRSLDICPYKQIPNINFYHTLFMDQHFFVFPEFVDTTVRCPEGNTYKRIKGIIQVRRECSLTSLVVGNIPENTHKEKLPSHTTHLRELKINITHIKFVTNKLHHLYLQNISSFSGAVKENLPTHLKTHFHFPIIMSPIVIALIVMLIVLYFIFVVRKSTKLFEFLSGKMKTMRRWENTELQHADEWPEGPPEPADSNWLKFPEVKEKYPVQVPDEEDQKDVEAQNEA